MSINLKESSSLQNYDGYQPDDVNSIDYLKIPHDTPKMPNVKNLAKRFDSSNTIQSNKSNIEEIFSSKRNNCLPLEVKRNFKTLEELSVKSNAESQPFSTKYDPDNINMVTPDHDGHISLIDSNIKSDNHIETSSIKSREQIFGVTLRKVTTIKEFYSKAPELKKQTHNAYVINVKGPAMDSQDIMDTEDEVFYNDIPTIDKEIKQKVESYHQSINDFFEKGMNHFEVGTDPHSEQTLDSQSEKQFLNDETSNIYADSEKKFKWKVHINKNPYRGCRPLSNYSLNHVVKNLGDLNPMDNNMTALKNSQDNLFSGKMERVSSCDVYSDASHLILQATLKNLIDNQDIITTDLKETKETKTLSTHKTPVQKKIETKTGNKPPLTRTKSIEDLLNSYKFIKNIGEKKEKQMSITSVTSNDSSKQRSSSEPDIYSNVRHSNSKNNANILTDNQDPVFTHVKKSTEKKTSVNSYTPVEKKIAAKKNYEPTLTRRKSIENLLTSYKNIKNISEKNDQQISISSGTNNGDSKERTTSASALKSTGKILENNTKQQSSESSFKSIMKVAKESQLNELRSNTGETPSPNNEENCNALKSHTEIFGNSITERVQGSNQILENPLELNLNPSKSDQVSLNLLDVNNHGVIQIDEKNISNVESMHSNSNNSNKIEKKLSSSISIDSLQHSNIAKLDEKNISQTLLSKNEQTKTKGNINSSFRYSTHIQNSGAKSFPEEETSSQLNDTAPLCVNEKKDLQSLETILFQENTMIIDNNAKISSQNKHNGNSFSNTEQMNEMKTKTTNHLSKFPSPVSNINVKKITNNSNKCNEIDEIASGFMNIKLKLEPSIEIESGSKQGNDTDTDFFRQPSYRTIRNVFLKYDKVTPTSGDKVNRNSKLPRIGGGTTFQRSSNILTPINPSSDNEDKIMYNSKKNDENDIYLTDANIVKEDMGVIEKLDEITSQAQIQKIVIKGAKKSKGVVDKIDKTHHSTKDITDASIPEHSPFSFSKQRIATFTKDEITGKPEEDF